MKIKDQKMKQGKRGQMREIQRLTEHQERVSELIREILYNGRGVRNEWED